MVTNLLHGLALLVLELVFGCEAIVYLWVDVCCLLLRNVFFA